MPEPLAQEDPESMEYSQDVASEARVTETVRLILREDRKVTEGGSGAVESMVMVTAGVERALVFPRKSEAEAVKEKLPLPRFVVGMISQLPETSALAEARKDPSLKREISVLASAVPEKVGVASEVIVPEIGARITGAEGGVESMVMVTAGVERVLMFPRESEAEAVKEMVPSLRLEEGMISQLPETSVLAEARKEPS